MIFKPSRTDTLQHSLEATTLQNVKDNLRITDTEEDDLLQEYIIAATDRLEGWLGQCFRFCENISYYNFCGNCATAFLIKGTPFIGIKKFEYFTDGAYVTLADTEYFLNQNSVQTVLCLKDTIDVDDEVPDPVKITFFLGYNKSIDVTSLNYADPNSELTVTTGHGLEIDDDILNIGSDQDDFNGIFTLITADTTQLDYLVGTGLTQPTEIGLFFSEDVPTLIQIAIKQMVAKMYANRGDCCDDCGDVPCGVQKLLRGLKTMRIRTSGPVYGCCC